MLGAFENLKVSANIYGNTPVTLKALDYVQLDEGIYDPNDMPEGITIEVGKITCGNDFTSANTPYSITVNDNCQTCGLDNQLGSFVAPIASGKDHSLPVKIPTVLELEEIAQANQTSLLYATNTEEVFAYPNPVTDFFQIVASEKTARVILMDSYGSEVKVFDSSDKIFDIREVAQGVYTIILTLNNHETKHIQVVKL